MVGQYPKFSCVGVGEGGGDMVGEYCNRLVFENL